MHWVKELLSFVGIELPKPKGLEEGKSVGAAVRNVGFTDPLEVLKKSQASAYMLGKGLAEDPAKATASAAKEIADKAKQIEDLIRNLPKDIRDFVINELPGKIGTAVLAAWNATKQNLKQGAEWVGRDKENIASDFARLAAGGLFAGVNYHALATEQINRQQNLNPHPPGGG